MAAHAEAAGRASRPMHLGHLASAQASAGRPAVALSLVENAIAEAEKTEDKNFVVELYACAATYCCDRKRSRKSKHRCNAPRRSLTGSERNSEELRAATTLADILNAEERPAEALGPLVPLAHSFTEGADVPDLKKARVLLKSFRHQQRIRANVRKWPAAQILCLNLGNELDRVLIQKACRTVMKPGRIAR